MGNGPCFAVVRRLVRKREKCLEQIYNKSFDICYQMALGQWKVIKGRRCGVGGGGGGGEMFCHLFLFFFFSDPQQVGKLFLMQPYSCLHIDAYTQKEKKKENREDSVPEVLVVFFLFFFSTVATHKIQWQQLNVSPPQFCGRECERLSSFWTTRDGNKLLTILSNWEHHPDHPCLVGRGGVTCWLLGFCGSYIKRY